MSRTVQPCFFLITLPCSPATHSQGKPQAIARIRRQYPYNNVVMIGDGISDLEAVEATGGADIFICYGALCVRKKELPVLRVKF